MIWIDAHADMNTPESSPSGNVHGMPLACASPLGPQELTGIFGYSPKIDPKNIALSDSVLSMRSNASTSSSRACLRSPCGRLMNGAWERCWTTPSESRPMDTAGFHLSLDMDSIDPQEAPGVGTPVRGGLTYREAHLAMEVVCDSGKMPSMEVVEVNPVIDESNRTAVLAVELVMSAMGKRIL